MSKIAYNKCYTCKNKEFQFIANPYFNCSKRKNKVHKFEDTKNCEFFEKKEKE
jgi:hypothetical protein